MACSEYLNRVERALFNEFGGDGGLHQVVDVRRNQHAVTGAIEGMAGSTNALDRARNAFRCRDHDDEIDRADVDAELETGGANNGAQFAIFQSVFDFETYAAIERSVMRFDLVAEIRQQFFQAQSNLFRRGATLVKTRTDWRSESVPPAPHKAGRRCNRLADRDVSDRRENFDDRFLFDLRFGDTTWPIRPTRNCVRSRAARQWRKVRCDKVRRLRNTRTSQAFQSSSEIVRSAPRLLPANE